MRLLCIHHEPSSDGGTLLTPARASAWTIEHCARARRGAAAGACRRRAVVAYGGTMNPDEDARLAWLADVRATLAEAVERDVAVLGICLGAQLARPGARRRRAAARAPRARLAVGELTPAGVEDVLLGPLAPACEVFQWHDYGCELPAGAVTLARSERAPQQAYRVGDAVWAVQFHIEVDAETVARWTRPPRRSRAPAGQSPPSWSTRAGLRGRVRRDRALPDEPLPDRRAQPSR